MRVVLIISCFLLHLQLSAQLPRVPGGFHLAGDAMAGSDSVIHDFDGDHTPDAFCAARKEAEEGLRLLAILQSGKRVRYSLPLSSCCGSIEQNKGVVRVSSTGMRGFSYYQFRWDSTAGDFRLIGYQTESFGNAANDGSGKSSLNLITGDFEAAFNSFDQRRQKLLPLPVVKRRISVNRKFYLQHFGDKEDEYLSDLTYHMLPKAVQ